MINTFYVPVIAWFILRPSFPLFPVLFKELAYSLHIIQSYSGPWAFFCEFDKQFDKRELTGAFWVLSQHRDNSQDLLSGNGKTSRKVSGEVLPVY